jgi:hypothetical protein
MGYIFFDRSCPFAALDLESLEEQKGQNKEEDAQRIQRSKRQLDTPSDEVIHHCQLCLINSIYTIKRGFVGAKRPRVV